MHVRFWDNIIFIKYKLIYWEYNWSASLLRRLLIRKFLVLCCPLAVKGSCGNGVQLNAGQADVKLDGKTFRNKPIDSVTIAMWLNATSVKGKHYLFDTIGGHSAHKHDQYLLMMENGAIGWSHNDQNDKQLFKVVTDPIVTESKFTVYFFITIYGNFSLTFILLISIWWKISHPEENLD